MSFRATREDTSVGQEAETVGARDESWPWPLLGFPWERQGWVNSLDLTNLVGSKLKGMSLFVHYLALDDEGRGILPYRVCEPDGEGRALFGLVCISKACSQSDPSPRIGQ